MATIEQDAAARRAVARKESIRGLVTAVTDPQRAEQERPRPDRF